MSPSKNIELYISRLMRILGSPSCSSEIKLKSQGCPLSAAFSPCYSASLQDIYVPEGFDKPGSIRGKSQNITAYTMPVFVLTLYA